MNWQIRNTATNDVVAVYLNRREALDHVVTHEEVVEPAGTAAMRHEANGANGAISPPGLIADMSAFVMVAAYTLLLGWIGWSVCFTEDTLGGWLPFMAIILGPVIGWAARSVLDEQA